MNFGGKQVPRVIADYSDFQINEMDDLKPIGHFYLPLPDKWRMNDLGVDYLYTGDFNSLFMLPNGLKQLVNYSVWQNLKEDDNIFPLINSNHLSSNLHSSLNFLKLDTDEINDEILSEIKDRKNLVIILNSIKANFMADMRNSFLKFINAKITHTNCYFKYLFGKRYK